MKISKSSKLGITIQGIAFAFMLLLVALSRPIPSLLAWLFNLGLAITLLGAFFTLHNTKGLHKS